MSPPWMNSKQIWLNNPKYRAANDGWGMCNTGSGKEVICSFGGIGCDVDHAVVAVGNLVDGNKVESKNNV